MVVPVMLSGARRAFFSAMQPSSPRAALGCFLAVFLLYAGYGLSFGEPPYFGGDAEQYWSMGAAFAKSWDWHALASYRGYLLPAVFGLLQSLAAALHVPAFSLFFVVNGAVTALSLVYILPDFMSLFVKGPPRAWQRLLLALAFYAFWRGYLLYPLSDAWALFAITGGVVAAGAAYRASNLTHAAGWALLAGVLAMASANMRPVFLIAVPMLGLGLLIRRAMPPVYVAALAFFCLGLCLPLMPQGYINKQALGTYNPLVHSGGLYVAQLFFGAELQRQECGYFTDPAGIAMLKEAGIDRYQPRSDGTILYPGIDARESFPLYLKLLAAHPLDFAALYIRHVLSGSYVLGANLYKCPSVPRYTTMLLSMLLFWAGLLGGAWGSWRLLQRQPTGTRINVAALCMLLAPVVPVLATIPTAIEGRFFMPLHLLAYMALLFVLPRVAGKHEWKARMPLLAAMGTVILMVGLVQISAMYAHFDQWVKADATGVTLRPTILLLDGK